MNYIKQLTFLRFLAALLIVVFHFGKETWPFSLNPISDFINEGTIAVSFFYFLSGVVLALNYLNNKEFSVRSFFIKRFARIYPVYILAFLTTLVMVTTFTNSYPKMGSILLQIFSLHAWFPGICLEINFPSWSISVEVFFYFLFPLILVLLKRLSSTKSTTLIISFWLLSILQHYLFAHYLYIPYDLRIEQFILYFPLWHLNTFLFGILCAKYIINKRKMNPQNILKSRISYTIGVIAFFLILNTDNYIRPYTHNGLMAPVFFMIVAGLSADKSILTRILGNRVFVLLGNASYSIYIFQWPAFIGLCAIMRTDKLEGYYFHLYLISLVLFSVVIYVFFERKMKKVITGKLIKTKHN